MKSTATIFFYVGDTTTARSSASAFQCRVDHLRTRRQWRTAAANVLLEAPLSEQSVHVAVRIPMLLQLLSCWFAGHKMHSNVHHRHGTFVGSRAAIQTCIAGLECSAVAHQCGYCYMIIVYSYYLRDMRSPDHACVLCELHAKLCS